MTSDEDMEMQLKALNAVFAAKLGERFSRMDQVLQMCASDTQNVDALNELHRLLHSLAGSAGTFGFDALGLKAREIEGLVIAIKAAGTPASSDLDRIAVALVSLKALATISDQTHTIQS